MRIRHVAKSFDDGNQLNSASGNTTQVLQETSCRIPDSPILGCLRYLERSFNSLFQFKRTARQPYHVADQTYEVMDVATAKFAEGFLSPKQRLVTIPNASRQLIVVLPCVIAYQVLQFSRRKTSRTGVQP